MPASSGMNSYGMSLLSTNEAAAMKTAVHTGAPNG
jgi:hypothetical protein